MVEPDSNTVAGSAEEHDKGPEEAVYNAEETDMPVPRDSSASTESKSWKDRAREKMSTGVDFVKEKSGAGIGYVKEKTAPGVNYVKEKAEPSVNFVKEKTAPSVAYVKEKSEKGVDFVKEKSKIVKEKVGDGMDTIKEKSKKVWGDGRGHLERVKNQIQEGQWKGSASKTLGVSEKEGLWKDIKVKGAEEITVPARKEHTTAYLVKKGTLLRWTFRVKQHDMGFGVRMRVMQDGGSVEETVLPVEKFDDQETISGSWMADEDRTMVLVFDNTYSKLRSKTVAYIVGIETSPTVEPIEVKVAQTNDDVRNENEPVNTHGTANIPTLPTLPTGDSYENVPLI